MLRADPYIVHPQGCTALNPLDSVISLATEIVADASLRLKKCLMRNNFMSFVGSFGNRSYLSSGIKKTEG